MQKSPHLKLIVRCSHDLQPLRSKTPSRVILISPKMVEFAELEIPPSPPWTGLFPMRPFPPDHRNVHNRRKGKEYRWSE